MLTSLILSVLTLVTQAISINDAATSDQARIPEIPADIIITADEIRYNEMHKGEGNTIVEAGYKACTSKLDAAQCDKFFVEVERERCPRDNPHCRR